MHPYRPEGKHDPVPSVEVLRKSIGTGNIYQGLCVKCDEYHNLHLDLGPLKGIIPREEAATGLAEGRTKEIAILSRVGKEVCFQVLDFDRNGNAILSRKAAQLDAKNYFFSALHPGDVIPARVLNATELGVFCDIGCGFTALMRIDRCCISRLNTAAAIFHPGQDILACVLAINDFQGTIDLTGRELLGTWEENASVFRPGQTVTGIVRSIMPYGIFVELAPNLSGLTEPTDGIQPGDRVSVYIRSILASSHKIKLNILEVLPHSASAPTLEYRIQKGPLRQWQYYPGSTALTVF